MQIGSNLHVSAIYQNIAFKVLYDGMVKPISIRLKILKNVSRDHNKILKINYRSGTHV